MKQNPRETIGDGSNRPQSKKTRRKSVAAILKDAYQRYGRDGLTLRAVKAVLH